MRAIDQSAPFKKHTKENLKDKKPRITKGLLKSIKKKYIPLKKIMKSNHRFTFFLSYMDL